MKITRSFWVYAASAAFVFGVEPSAPISTDQASLPASDKSAPAGASVRATDQQPAMPLPKTLQHADKNGDGKIEMSERMAEMQRLRSLSEVALLPPEMRTPEQEKAIAAEIDRRRAIILERHDSNKDGRIDEVERAAIMTQKLMADIQIADSGLPSSAQADAARLSAITTEIQRRRAIREEAGSLSAAQPEKDVKK